MQYLHTMIRVESLDKSMQFYCDLLGLKEVNRYESSAGKFTLVYLSAPDDFETASASKAPTIELTYNWPDDNGAVESYSGGRNFGHLAFAVDDIYALCEKLQSNGVVINRPPRDGHMAFVRSPDGISIELLQKGESLAPVEPWKSMPSVGEW